MENDFNKENNRIERLKKKLYSNSGIKNFRPTRTPIESEESDVSTEWQSTEKGNKRNLYKNFKKIPTMSTAKLAFWFSLILFIVAAGIAAFMFLGGNNLVSVKNVGIDISGPISVAGGQSVDLEITIQNRNRAALDSTVLTIIFPEGTTEANNPTSPLVREKESIGEIPAGGELKKKISLSLFGEKESIKKIKFSVEYRVKNSSATFVKEKDYEIKISSSPLVMSVDYPKEVNSGQSVEFNIKISSNSEELIPNIRLAAEYPFGFDFELSKPSPSRGDNVWDLGDLSPGQNMNIFVIGTIVGQDNEERFFKFSSGVTSDQYSDSVDSVFSLFAESVLIKKPFLGLDLVLNQSANDILIAKSGQQIQGNLAIINNILEEIFDISVEVEINGEIFDRSSVFASKGFFRSIDNTILWEKETMGDLGRMSPGNKIVFPFSFSSKNISNNVLRNPKINIKVTATGNRVMESGKVETITSEIERNIKIATNVSLIPRLSYSEGPFSNFGPIPPKAEKETSYTVTWSLSNSFNDIYNTEVRALLPSYVKWNGSISPSTEKVSFNNSTNEVIWNAGSISSGVGIGSSPREVSFQIFFLPSLSQVGTEPILVGDMKVRAMDKFTDTLIESSRSALTSNISVDFGASFNSGKVVK